MRIEHIAMYVHDLEGARNFFVKYFNAESNEGYHNKKCGQVYPSGEEVSAFREADSRSAERFGQRRICSCTG